MHDAVSRPSEDASRQGYVLIVSADRPWLASVTAFLAVFVRALSTAETAAEAIDSAMGHPPDVAVIAPPIGDGSPMSLINHLAVLRERAPLGIVYVTDRDREVVMHRRLMKAGANDWFSRTLPLESVARRIASVVREIRPDEPVQRIIRGPLSLDTRMREVRVNGVPVELSDVEFAILTSLARSAGRMMSLGEVASATGARRGSRASRAISGHVDALRLKLGVAQDVLEVSRRDGYRLRFVTSS